MSRVTVEKLYQETLSLPDVMADEISRADDRTRFWVLQKHIRFHVLNAIVTRRYGMDLKRYILKNHHTGQQLSQRDITAKIKRMVDDIDDEKTDEKKLVLVKEVCDEVWKILQNIQIIKCRGNLLSTLSNPSGDIGEKAKKALMNRAMSTNGGEILQRLKSFDHKTIADFIGVFRLPMRKRHEKWDGKSAKKKFTNNCKERNVKRWSDPKNKLQMSKTMQRVWAIRRVEEFNEV